MAAIFGPLLGEIPPRLGSHRPQDLLRQGLLLRHLRKLDTRAAVDATRLATGSIADLLDRYFTSDAVRGLLSVSGVIGTGPARGRAGPGASCCITTSAAWTGRPGPGDSLAAGWAGSPRR